MTTASNCEAAACEEWFSKFNSASSAGMSVVTSFGLDSAGSGSVEFTAPTGNTKKFYVYGGAVVCTTGYSGKFEGEMVGRLVEMGISLAEYLAD